MWKILLLTALIAAAIFGASVFKNELQTNPALNAKIAEIAEKIGPLRNTATHILDEFKVKDNNIVKDPAKETVAETAKVTVKDTAKDPPQPDESGEMVSLYLKHGGVVRGRLVDKRSDEYEVEGRTGKYVVLKSQVIRIGSKDENNAAWAYKNAVVVKKTNGIIMDGQIVEADDNNITLSFTEGGGNIEMGVDRKDISHLIFAPIWNKETIQTEARLEKLFPKMSVYKEDNFTLLTDASSEWIKAYTKELNDQYTGIYLRFFGLFKNRKQDGQNFVILFDDPGDYIKYTVASMGPMNALGYFDPDDRTLFIYNGWGARFEKLYRDYIEGICSAIDEHAKDEKTKLADGGWHITVDGYAKEQKDVLWKWYDLHKRIALDETFEVMRHEFTHEIFHNWGLQGIVTSRPPVDKDKMAAKEKEILDALESKDQEKIEGVFKDLYKMKKNYYEDLEMNVSNSWLAEGIATYCETSPLGTINERFLAGYQVMSDKNRINPLEFITNFKKGSFSGLNYQSMLDGYAESWGFTKFLMERYPAQFIDYQNRMADRLMQKKIAEASEDDFNLLLKCLNKDLPALETEFKEYMTRFERVDDPMVKRVLEYEKMYDEFRNVHERREKSYIYFK